MGGSSTNRSHGGSTVVGGPLKAVLAGLLLGTLIGGAALLSGLVTGGQSWSRVVVAVVASTAILVAAIAGVTRWPHPPDRSVRRRLAAGLGVGTILAVVTAVAWGIWTGFDPFAISQGQIDTAVENITSAHREGFYLGDEADGQHLEKISDLQPDGVLFFEYGRCMDHDEGGCTRPLTVSSQPTKSFGSRGETAAGCRAVPPVLGVPAAALAGDLVVFTGASMVSITYLKVVPHGYNADQSRQAAVAPQLRAIGQSMPAKGLPSPDADTLAFVERHCGGSSR